MHKTPPKLASRPHYIAHSVLVILANCTLRSFHIVDRILSLHCSENKCHVKWLSNSTARAELVTKDSDVTSVH